MTTRRGRRKSGEMRVPSILTRADMNAMARRRCMMLLAVLSGHQSVADAIKDAQISAGTYYQLESRALLAMMQALAPQSATEDGAPSSWTLVSRLEAKVKKLEMEKRRLARLLSLTKRVIRPGPMKLSTPRRSKSSSSTTMDIDRKADQPSTPTASGEGAP